MCPQQWVTGKRTQNERSFFKFPIEIRSLKISGIFSSSSFQKPYQVSKGCPSACHGCCCYFSDGAVTKCQKKRTKKKHGKRDDDNYGSRSYYYCVFILCSLLAFLSSGIVQAKPNEFAAGINYYSFALTTSAARCRKNKLMKICLLEGIA